MECQFCKDFAGVVNPICGQVVGPHFTLGGGQNTHCTRIHGHIGPHVSCNPINNHMFAFRITDDSYLTFEIKNYGMPFLQ